MWHVSDGDVHAYLDGALEFYPPAEAARIRAHLKVCADCDRRVAEETMVRERARAVLAEAAVGDVPLLPLEELRRRAEDTGPRERTGGGSSFGPQQWAWAATVVLALGVGWGVGAWRTGSAPVGRPASELEEAAAPGSFGSAPAEALSAGAGSPERAASGSLPSDEAAPASAPPAAELDAGFQAMGKAMSEWPAADLVAGREVATPPALGAHPVAANAERAAMPASEVAVAPTAGTQRGTLSGDDFRAEARARASSEPQPAGAQQERARTEAVRPEAAASLTIPGLEVQSVEWTEVAAGQQGIRVLQRFSDGTPVELRFLDVALEEALTLEQRVLTDADDRPRAAPSDAGAAPPAHLLGAPLPEGWRQAARPFRGGWMLIRGPLEESRLRALAEAVR